MNIESYVIGKLVVDGREYSSDVVLTNDGRVENWQRGEGAMLQRSDIEGAVTSSKPDVVVVGTGKHNTLRINKEFRSYLKENGIKLLAEPTDLACRTFNRLAKARKQLIGAFYVGA